MFGHVAQPDAFVQPLDEATAPAAATGVVQQAQLSRHSSKEASANGLVVGRKVFEHTEIDDQLDGRFVVPDVRTAEDPARDDLEIGGVESETRSRS